MYYRVTIPVSILRPEKLPGNMWRKGGEWYFWHCGIAPKCVHLIKDSTLILMRDQLCFFCEW